LPKAHFTKLLGQFEVNPDDGDKNKKNFIFSPVHSYSSSYSDVASMVGSDSESENFNNRHMVIIEASVDLQNRKNIEKNCSPLRRSQRIGGLKANFYENDTQLHNKNNELKNFKELRKNFRNIEIDNSFDKSNNINNNSTTINKNKKNYQLHETINNQISIDNNKKLLIINNSDNEINNNNKILISNKFNMK
jgi:hypothetical protein